MIKGLERGDVVVLDLDPVLGREQGRQRPCVVLSGRDFNDLGHLLVIAPVTSKVRGYPFEVPFQVGRFSGVVLVDQIRTIDVQASQVVRYLPKATIPHPALLEVQARLDALLFR